MEHTKHKLTDYEKIFFNKLSNYLETKLYFFGSIQRDDYFPGLSDIDVDIFTENENSTIAKLSNYLNLNKYEFKKVIWKLNTTGQLVNGYKFMYRDLKNKLVVEFSIYSEKFKKQIIDEHNSKINIPFYATILLVILKYLFYKLNIIPDEWYIKGKKFILSPLIGKPYDDFVRL
jgi:predicted nucleotidyltransferase